MSFRKFLEKYQGASTVFALLLLIGAGSIFFYGVRGSRGYPPGISDMAFFTTDDTLTGPAAVEALFVDSAQKVAPFDHNGKPAFRAYVFVCDGGRTRWVNHLKRYQPAMQKRVQDVFNAESAKGNRVEVDTSDWDRSGVRLKLPGVGKWLGPEDIGFRDVANIHPPENANLTDVDVCVP